MTFCNAQVHVICTFIFLGYCITTGRLFLSWQTWDLLHLMVYGSIEFYQYFTQKYPGYTIYPIRLNGSAVESYFSTLRAITSGNLTSTNYAATSATAQLKRLTRASTKFSSYRKSHLSFRQLKLDRRKKHKK